MSGRAKTVAMLWASYRAEVLHADAPPVQVRECRQAFYAGAYSTFEAMAEVSGGPEDTALTFMGRLRAEFLEFADEAKALAEQTCSYCRAPMTDPPEACPEQDDPGGPCAVVEGLIDG